jgi:methionine-rich copper-binding protein CopC
VKRLLAPLLVVGLLVMQTAPAEAHAQLISSNPKVSATLYKSPTTVTLTFDDDLIDLASANLIQVFNSKNKRIDRAGTKLNGSTMSTALLANLPVGKYRVTYRVLSADGHPVTATYYFYLKMK